MVPKYEVKLLMDPKIVLDKEHTLERTVLETFAISTPAMKMNLQFLDTSKKDMYKHGWSARIRKVQGDADCQLTYKKRYKVAKDDIDAALVAASKDGFDSSATTYKAEVDWGYENQTLSIKRDKSHADARHPGLELPGVTESRHMLIEKAPRKFIDAVESNWGINKLEESRLYGPVFTERYTGTWSDKKLVVEVWPIRAATGTGIEYIVEASFKIKGHAKAVERRCQLTTLLETKG